LGFGFARFYLPVAKAQSPEYLDSRLRAGMIWGWRFSPVKRFTVGGRIVNGVHLLGLIRLIVDSFFVLSQV
jgi:hypothetical protein